MVVSALAPGGGRNSSPQISKRDVSSCHAGLIEMVQRINFGRIEELQIRDGLPILSPRPRVSREIKFGGENGPRPEIDAADFLLKSQVVELFALFDALGNGTIDVLEIKHGLPFRAIVTEAAV